MTREEAKELLLHILMTYEPKDQYGDYDDPEPYEQALTMAIEALQDRPHGEWKNTITWQPYCSNCEYVFDEDEAYSPFWKFCPMCGAEMADNSLVNDITESPNDVVESKDDVIEVVRCKDCRWYEPKYKDKEYDCPQGLYAVYENDFCSHGERREQLPQYEEWQDAFDNLKVVKK